MVKINDTKVFDTAENLTTNYGSGNPPIIYVTYVETDTGKSKTGNGSSTYAALPYDITPASSTSATQSIYVDKAATGTGTGVDWTNAFTSIQAAVNSIPFFVQHAITIYVRKGATPYRELITVNRIVIGSGSITIRGEYYWNNQAAANSTENRLVKAATDDFTNVEVGDQVYLMQYSGTYQASVPTESYRGTVTDVTNKASGYVTISMESAVTPTTGWMYVICKTEISGSDDGSTPTRNNCISLLSPTNLYGLYLTLPADRAITQSQNEAYCYYNSIIIDAGTKCGTIVTVGSATYQYCAIDQSGTPTSVPMILGSQSKNYVQHCRIRGKAQVNNGVLTCQKYTDSSVSYCDIKALASSGSGAVIIATLKSNCMVTYSNLRGASSGDKVGYGTWASSGALIIRGYCNIETASMTTEITPANWASTTDGSYVI